MADCECCESIEIHEDLLKIVNETMPDENKLYDLAELFKVFGDSTRIRILYVLFEAEVCVCDLAQALNMTQSAISHQLRILKQNKLVKNRREGKSIFYSLADDHVRTIVDQGREHIEHIGEADDPQIRRAQQGQMMLVAHQVHDLHRPQEQRQRDDQRQSHAQPRRHADGTADVLHIPLAPVLAHQNAQAALHAEHNGDQQEHRLSLIHI